MEKEKNIKKDSVNTSQIYTSLSSSSIASGLNVRGTIVEQLKRPPLYVVRLIQVSSKLPGSRLAYSGVTQIQLSAKFFKAQKSLQLCMSTGRTVLL